MAQTQPLITLNLSSDRNQGGAGRGTRMPDNGKRMRGGEP